MVFRKLFLVFALIAGLCAFDGPVESSQLPRTEQTELVVSGHAQTGVVVGKIPSARLLFFVQNEEPLLSFHHHYTHSLLIQSQQHHATL